MHHRVRAALALVTGASVAFASMSTLGGSAQAATPVTESYTTPGGPYPFVVPNGVTSIHVHAVGGAGGFKGGGRGADVTSDLPVTPGQTLFVYVAGNGGGPAGDQTAGINGGGAGQPVHDTFFSPGGGGGGASDVRTTAGDLATRLIVAGGGGGGAYVAPAGDAGNPGTSLSFTSVLAQPGTETAGGAAGQNHDGNGNPGTFGQGGDGVGANNFNSGAGGGGWYGGGSGGVYGSGAGGSSHVTSMASNTSIGVDSTRIPSVTITYTPTPWRTTGFYQPIDMSGVYNTVKGGATVPVKFNVYDGTTEVTDPSKVSFAASRVSCTVGTPTDDVEVTATGATSLRYDATAGRFVYNWQTPRAASSCYRLTMTTGDGSTTNALFRLT